MISTNGRLPDHQQMVPQPQMIPQPQNLPDIGSLINEKTRIILDPSERPAVKLKAMEGLKDLYDDIYVKEQTSLMAQCAVQIFQSVVNSYRPAFADNTVVYRLRRLALEFVVRFVPVDAYKASSKQFEELFYSTIPDENEPMAVIMLRYVGDMLKNQRILSAHGIIPLVNNLRMALDNIVATYQANLNQEKPAYFFSKFNVPENSDENSLGRFVEIIHFETSVRVPKMVLYPKAKNSIKVIIELMALEHYCLFVFKERMFDDLPSYVKILSNLLSVNPPKSQCDPEFLSTFHDAQYKCLMYLGALMKSRDQNQPPLQPILVAVRPCLRDIALGTRSLLRNLGTPSASARKDVLQLIKQMLNSPDIRVELLDILPELCYEEIIVGPPAVITSGHRSELYMLKADIFHNARNSIDWSTFQLLLTFAIRDCTDYTLTPTIQSIFAKLISSYIDACQKAEDSRFPQLSVGYTYDSARVMFEGMFQVISKKIHVLTQKALKELLMQTNIGNLNEKFEEKREKELDEFYRKVKENGWKDSIENDGEACGVFLKNKATLIDRFEEESSDEEESDFYTNAVKKVAEKRLETLTRKLIQGARSGKYVEKDKDFVKKSKKFMEFLIENKSESVSSLIKENMEILSGSSIEIKDSRVQMLWLDRKSTKFLPIQIYKPKNKNLVPFSTFNPPEEFPYNISDVRLILKNYAIALKTLMMALHQDDDMKSSNPSNVHMMYLNRLFGDFLVILEMGSSTSFSDDNSKVKQIATYNDDKDIMEAYIQTFALLHPAVFEKILRNHLMYILRRNQVSLTVFTAFMTMISNNCLMPSACTVFLEVMMENVDLFFAVDDEDYLKSSAVHAKAFKSLLSYLVHILPMEPHQYDFIPRFQKFILEFVTKGLRSVLRSTDQNVASTNIVPPSSLNLIKVLFRQCGMVQGEPIYKLFLPLFPTFLQIFSSAQNAFSTEVIQDLLIELCLSLPARLSSLIPFMPLLVDPAINSLQNFNSWFNPQGLRTIELCLDNYTATQIKEFFGNNFQRLHEHLWNMVSHNDQSFAQQAVRLIGKLSAMNRNILCDTQRLQFNDDVKDESIKLIVKFERCGRRPDSVFMDHLLTGQPDGQVPEYPDPQFFERMYSMEEDTPSGEPFVAQISMNSLIPYYVSVIRLTLTNENNTHKSYFQNGRSEAASLCLGFVRFCFDTFGQGYCQDEDFMASSVLLNNFIVTRSEERLNVLNFERPTGSRNNEGKIMRQSLVDALTGVIFAASNADFKQKYSKELEMIVDNLTLGLHFQKGLPYFEDEGLSGMNVSPVDGTVLIDAICQIYCDPHVKLHGAASVTLLRIIQTAMSFNSSEETALNIPLFYYILDEFKNLCSRPNYVERLGGISGIEILVENLPRNFVFANYSTLWNACLSVLQYGDDDVSLMSQETAISVYRKILDSTMFDGRNSDRELRKKALLYLAEFVVENWRYSSNWVSHMLGEILWTLRIQKDIKRKELFSGSKVNEILKWHFEEFPVSSLEFKLSQLKNVNALLRCIDQPVIFTDSAARYFPCLLFTYIYTDEELSSSPNYEKVPLHPPQGANLVHSSILLKYNNGILYLDRVKEYRKVVAEVLTSFCVNLLESNENVVIGSDVEFDPGVIVENPPKNTQDVINTIFGLHVFSAKSFLDCRQEYSLEGISMLANRFKVTKRNDITDDIVSLIKESPENIRLLKLLNALTRSKEDLSHSSLDKLLVSEGEYEPIYSLLPQLCHLKEEHLECLVSFLMLFQKCDYSKNEKLLNGLVSLISNPEMIHLHEIDSFNVYGSIAIFLGSQKSDFPGNFVISYFLSIEAMKDPEKRDGFSRLISHKEAFLLRSMILNFETTLIKILKNHKLSLEDGTEKKIRTVDYGVVDEFILKILMQFVRQHPNYFGRNHKLGTELRNFYLSDYFRGNYSFSDHGLDNTNRLKLTEFAEWKTTVPEMMQNLLIRFMMKNPSRFDILLTLCTAFHQAYCNDNNSLRRFISKFIVPKTLLSWKRELLKYAIDLTAKVLQQKPDANDKFEVYKHQDIQIYLGHFFLYVIYPCFKFSFQHFPSLLVAVGSRDHFLKKKFWKRRKEGFYKKKDNSPDLVKMFCEVVLDKFVGRLQEVRPEIAYGLIQFSILLMQRAATHIHALGSKQQSKHLQLCMQIAWPSLSGTGIYADKGLRSVAQFFLATVMNAVYIKKDIVYQHFDSLMGYTDNRENQIIQNALDTVAYHVAFGRKDDCMNGFIDRIRGYLNSDGFNLIKAGNALHMLMRNFENFFAYRHHLVASIAFMMIRIHIGKSAMGLNCIADGLEIIIGWEELLQDKIKKLNEVEENDRIPQEERSARRARILQSPEFLSLDKTLADTVAIVLCRAVMQTYQDKDAERHKKIAGLFQRALNPRILCRAICVKLERMLMPRDFPPDHPQLQNFVNQAATVAKILANLFIGTPAESVYQCLIYLQGCFRPCIHLGQKLLFEAVVFLITKIMEVTKEFSLHDRRFSPVFNALEEYFSIIGDNFIKKPEWSEVALMIQAMKSICLINETAYHQFCGPGFISVMKQMVKTYRIIPQNITDGNTYEKRNAELLISAMEVFQQRASITAENNMRLYIQHVVYPLLTHNENLPGKLMELCSKTLEESVKVGQISRQHISAISAFTRHHTNAAMKHPASILSYFNTVAMMIENKLGFEHEFVDIWIPFYLGLGSNEVSIRSKFLDIFETKLPTNFYERLCYLLTYESWQMVNGTTILSIILDLLLRCVKGIDYGRPPLRKSQKPDYFKEGPTIVDPDVVEVENQVEMKPKISFPFLMNEYIHCMKNIKEVENWKKFIPSPCSSGKFKNCEMEYKPLNLTTIINNFQKYTVSCENSLKNNFPNIVMIMMTLIVNEPELAGKLFLEIFTSIWTSMTDFERGIISELYGHFMQMPIFSSASPLSVRPLWQVVTRCDPWMKVDHIKMTSNPCGPKNIHYSILAMEKNLKRSVNLMETTSELKSLYTVIDEYDMYSSVWKILPYSESGWKSFFFFNQSRFDEAFKFSKKSQKEIIEKIGEGIQVIDESNAGLKTDFDSITELGVFSKKEKNDWKYVLEFAEKNKDLPLAIEANFHLARSIDDWNEIEQHLKLLGSVEDPTLCFKILIYRLSSLIFRCDSPIINDEGYQDKLTQYLVERFRRIPYFCSPRHYEVLRDCAVWIDLIDGISITKEMARTDILNVIETTIKSLILQWRFRAVSRADSPASGATLLRFRLSLLWMINNQILAQRPELKNPEGVSYSLTPMHNIADHVMQISKHLRRFKLYDEAKKELASLDSAGLLNPFDCCLTMCEMMKCSMKEYLKNPDGIDKNSLMKEFVYFCEANLDSFKPDVMAYYSAVRGELFNLLGDEKRSEQCYRIALKLESTFDQQVITVFNPLAQKVLKSSAKYLYKENCEKWNDERSINGIQGVFDLLHRLKPTETVEYVSKLIYSMKRYAESGSDTSKLEKIVNVFAPKISTVVFLQFLNPIISEIKNTKSKVFGTLLTLIHQVFPIHVVHGILLEIGAEEFYKVVGKVKKELSLKNDLERINTDIPEDDESARIRVFPVFKSSPDPSNMEQISRSSVFFEEWGKIDIGKFEDGTALLTYFLERISSFVPSEVLAFCDIVRNLENMKRTKFEILLKTIMQLWNKILKNENGREILEEIREVLDTVDDSRRFKNVKKKISNMMEFLSEAPEFHQKLEVIAEVVASLEDYINKYENEQPLSEIAPDLLNFTSQRARIPAFSTFFEPQSGRCLPTIDIFYSKIKIFAKFGIYYRFLNVRLSDGKFATYLMDDTDSDEFFKSPFKCLYNFNFAIEKFYETNRRGALFRVPNVFQLPKMRLIEIGNIALNKYVELDDIVKPWMNTMFECVSEVEEVNVGKDEVGEVKAEEVEKLEDAEVEDVERMEVEEVKVKEVKKVEIKKIKEVHPFKQIAEFYKLISEGMDEFEAAFSLRKKYGSDGMTNYFGIRYNDAPNYWQVRKSAANQMALHSVLEYGIGWRSLRIKDLLVEHVYGKIWNLNPVFEEIDFEKIFEEKKRNPFRLDNSLAEFLDLSLDGHFAATFVATATCLFEKKFTTFLKPFYIDIYRNLKYGRKSTKLSSGDFAEIEKHLNLFEMKFKYISENPDTVVFELIEQARDLRNRLKEIEPSELPWI